MCDKKFLVHPPLPSSSSQASTSTLPPTTTTNQNTHLLHHQHQPRTTAGKHTIIERRNQRERVRVRAVNEAFARLRQVVPTTRFSPKRVSKVKTLKRAVEYIGDLQRRLATIEGMLLVDSSILQVPSCTAAGWKERRTTDNCKPFGA
ncbi:achaete-scute complex protein T4-like [Aedes albopictus]|uniref:BHLH domain-containing protein n=1 Tax=Aedes albopictus TaxID=7160 RepID=A0ABM1Z7M9_AEDAL